MGENTRDKRRKVDEMVAILLLSELISSRVDL
jgi:hypothetical protein